MESSAGGGGAGGGAEAGSAGGGGEVPNPNINCDCPNFAGPADEKEPKLVAGAFDPKGESET